MKIAVLAAVPLLLSACGLPTAVVVTSYAVDGVAFVSTGKTLTAHALSAATDKDCSILFGLTRGELCRDIEKPDESAKRDAGFVVPKDRPTADEPVAISAAAGGTTEPQMVLEPQFFDFDYETAPASLATAQPALEPKSAPGAHKLAANQPQWTLVLGTFADYRGAIDLAKQVKPEPGLVTTIIVGGKIHYRVSTEPLKRDQAVGRQLNIAALKLENVTLMPVCPLWVQQDNCVALDRTLAVQQATLP